MEDKADYDEASLNYMRQVYQERYEELSRSLDLEVKKIESYNKVLESVNKLDELKDKNTLSSFGQGFYIKSKIESTENLIVYVGGGYYVEKNGEDTKTFINLMINKERGIISNIIKAKDEVEEGLIKLEYGSLESYNR
jgi:prefoldin alpha subunit